MVLMGFSYSIHHVFCLMGFLWDFMVVFLDLMGSNGIYPLVVTNIAMEAMAIEIVSFDN